MTKTKINTTKAKFTAWIAALRSGQYKQGQGNLCRNVEGSKEYCCLGVFAEIHGMLADQPLGSLQTYPIKDTGQTAWLPFDVIAEGDQRTLGRMNDGAGPNGTSVQPVPFDMIADYIEENFEAVS